MTGVSRNGGRLTIYGTCGVMAVENGWMNVPTVALEDEVIPMVDRMHDDGWNFAEIL